MKKFLSIVLSLLILCSCSKIENEHTIFKNTTLTKLNVWFVNCDYNTIKELTGEFNYKFENISVNAEVFDKDTLSDKISDAIKTNTLPNAIFDYSNSAYTYKDFLISIDELWQQEILNDINQNLNPYIKYNGKRFMLPVGYDLNFFAINKSLVDEKYLADEYTIKTFEKLLQNTTSEIPFGFYYEENLLLEFMKNSGAYITINEKLNLDNKSFINSIKNIKNYISKEYINKDSLRYSKDKMLSLFLNKKVAVMPNFNLSDYYKCKEKGIEVLITHMPAKENVQAKISANVMGFCIIKNGVQKEIEATVKYIEYFSQNKRFITSLKIIPVRNWEQQFFDTSLLNNDIKTLINYSKDNILPPFNLNDKTSKTFDLFYDYLDKILKDNVSVDTAMQELNNLIY